MTRAVRLLLTCAALMALPSGCYNYVPVSAPAPGMEVRAQLTGEAAVRRSQGREEPVMRYEGIVVTAAPDTMALDVLVARASSGLQDVVIRDTVRLGTGELQSVMARELSVGRTALATIGAVAAGVAIAMSVEQIVGGTDDPPDDGTPNMRRPHVSWRLLRLLFGSR